MDSFKATAVSRWATERNYPLIRFDYSGTGLSGGEFEEATITDWHEVGAHRHYRVCAKRGCDRWIVTRRVARSAINAAFDGAWHEIVDEGNHSWWRRRLILLKGCFWNAFDDEIKRNIKTQGVRYRPTRLG